MVSVSVCPAAAPTLKEKAMEQGGMLQQSQRRLHKEGWSGWILNVD